MNFNSTTKWDTERFFLKYLGLPADVQQLGISVGGGHRVSSKRVPSQLLVLESAMMGTCIIY